MKCFILILLLTSSFAASALFANDDLCCAAVTANDAKANCSTTYANLNLTPAQTTKMEKLAAECDKGGCNAQTMAKMERGARKVLTRQQFAAWKAACSGHAQKTQS